MSELVTGEAVALELRPARLPSRALAVLVDLAAALVVYVGVGVGLLTATASLDTAARTALSIAAFVLVLVGAPVAVETLSHGRSLGKAACGLRVVRDDGGPIRFRHALVRGLIGVVEILMTFGAVACVASLASERGRRLGDVFAGTLVVRERVPSAPAGFVPPPPPWLAGRFSELDLSAVPDGLWLAVRQYLTRRGQLDPAVGRAMADRLAADVAVRTGTPAPQGVPADAYLAAVLQERQVREARRTFGAGSAGSAWASGAGGGTSPYFGGPAHAAPGPAPGAAPYGAPGATPYRAPGATPYGAAGTAAGAAHPQDPATSAGPAGGPAPRPSAPPQGGSGAAPEAGRSGEERGPDSGGRPGTGFVPPA
ncbi:RDD family protein [Streptomyces sp. SHP 1-2]|uniref:RDD family protein n=1 Tax=Streptomyces sp. SHP 1-2 TaxID=2769489 RepID=UPI0022374990|nr:RDD family protein [Streptomyces sp. SHP 1-2]MCW5253831.1 RDD family protein [Streptomyces sp. SHP 1-2]